MTDETAKKRPTYIHSVARWKLNAACATINSLLGDYGCYLVGSALRTPDHRDVDVRFIMVDDKYDALFAGEGHDELRDNMWSLLCVGVGAWLGEATGLPIDFQIQRQSNANESFPNREHRRHSLGHFLHYEGELPSFIREFNRLDLVGDRVDKVTHPKEPRFLVVDGTAHLVTKCFSNFAGAKGCMEPPRWCWPNEKDRNVASCDAHKAPGMMALETEESLDRYAKRNRLDEA